MLAPGAVHNRARYPARGSPSDAAATKSAYVRKAKVALYRGTRATTKTAARAYDPNSMLRENAQAASTSCVVSSRAF